MSAVRAAFAVGGKGRGTHSLVRVGVRGPRRAADGDKDLVIDRPGPGEELPVERARRRVEGTGIEHGHTALPGGAVRDDQTEGSQALDGSRQQIQSVPHGDLGEAHVVADAEAKLAKGCMQRGKDGQSLAVRQRATSYGRTRLEAVERLAAGERVRLLEGDAAGDVDVKEVDLAVDGDQLARRVVDGARVED
jgi:hypothetical protein